MPHRTTVRTFSAVAIAATLLLSLRAPARADEASGPSTAEPVTIPPATTAARPRCSTGRAKPSPMPTIAITRDSTVGPIA